uniref:Ig-like domain-containing protein n=1 Tax=Chrysemys picta bellii TaxID=8478 RepID=A0A8C3HJS6_CHRPI
QIQLVPSAPGVVKPGESLTVTCTVSGDSIATRAWWNWVRELPGRGLQWVGRIHFSGSTNYAPDLQTRANIAKDDAKNEFYLQLRSLTAADTATYYCTRWDPQQLRLFPVTIFLPSPKAPEIFPLCADSSFPIRKNVQLLFPNYLESSLAGRKCDSGIRSWPEAHLPCLLLLGSTYIPTRREKVVCHVSPKPDHHLFGHLQEPVLPAAGLPRSCRHRHVLLCWRHTGTQSKAGLVQKGEADCLESLGALSHSRLH